MESKMCNLSSFWTVVSSCENWVTQIWKNSSSVGFLSSIQSKWGATCLLLWSKLKKLWSFQYFWVLLHVLISIFYYSSSDTFNSSVHVSPCIICLFRKDELKNWKEKCVICHHFEKLWDLGNLNLKNSSSVGFFSSI